MIRLAKVSMLAPPQEPMRKKGKALIVPRVCPCVPSPTASLSLVPSDERSMHQNLPSSEQGPTIKRRISLGVKTITPFWSHRFQGYWGPSNFSTSALQICPPVTVHRAAGLQGAPAAWPSLNYLTSGHIILRLFIDSIPSRSISSLPAVFETAPPMLLP